MVVFRLFLTKLSLKYVKEKRLKEANGPQKLNKTDSVVPFSFGCISILGPKIFSYCFVLYTPSKFTLYIYVCVN